MRILENELPSFAQKLQEAYHLGNDINTRVADARQNLNALIARLETESNELIQFTRQLEVARAEKENADLVLETLLQQKSDALPYAVSGNANQATTIAINRDVNNTPSSSQQFYPFTFFTSGLGNNFSCDRSNSFQTIEGVIQRIYGNSMNVLGTDGQSYTVNVGSCSNLQSNRPNYSLAVGDKINFGGNIIGGHSLNLISGTCY